MIALLAVSCASVEERRRSSVERAERLLDQGDPGRALHVLDGFLRYDPRDLDVRSRMAEIYVDLGQPGSAIRLLDALPSDVKPDLRATRLLARALVDAKQVSRALAVASRLYERGELDAELEDALLRRLACCGARVDSDLPDAWVPRLVRLQLARRNFQAARVVLRRTDSEEHAQLFDELIQGALNADEIELLRTLGELERKPGSPWKLLARHRLLSVDGLADEAAAVEREFLSRYPEHSRRYEMLLSVARREIRSGRAEAGLRWARQASSLRPSESAPLVEQALALEALDRADEAERVLEMVLSASPHHSGARELLARMDRRRAKGDDRAGSSEGSVRVRLQIDSEGGR